MRAILGLGLLMAVSVQAGEGRGTDTGNGGIGGSLQLSMPQYSRLGGVPWCSGVRGMLEDALLLERLSPSIHEARMALIGSFRAILDSYDAGELGYQPLTYSLIARALQVQAVFPSTQNPLEYTTGDQSAVILLHHLALAAMDVSQNFDVIYYDPIQTYLGCHGDCERIYNDWNPGPMYVGFVGAASRVLNEFFEPAIPYQPAFGTVLDAMSHDRWELEAVYQILGWLVEDLDRDVFRRGLDCVRMGLASVQRRLGAYLDGTAGQPFDDRMMRFYVEKALRDAQLLLQNYQWENGYGRCTAHSGPRP